METNLKSIRKSRGMTQRQMAESIGEKVATYGTWERGTSTPNIEQLVRCARVLDCSTDEILSRKSQERPHQETDMEVSLKKIRKSRGLSQQEMAKLLGVKTTRYGSWERGERMLSAAQLVDCSRVLDCSTDEVLGMEIKTPFADQREAELHRIWRGLDRGRQDRLIASARDMKAAKSAESKTPEEDGASA